MNKLKWYKFLTEAKVFEGGGFSLGEFYNLWSKSQNFRQAVVDSVIKHKIIPLIKTFDDKEKEIFQKFFSKIGQEESVIGYPRFHARKLFINKEPRYYEFSNTSFENLFQYLITKDKKIIDSLLASDFQLFIEQLVKDGIFKYDMPIIKRPEISPNILKNVEILNKHYNIDAKQVANSDVLKVYEIDEFLGEGFYGRVYSAKDTNRILKFFKASVDMQKDLSRYNKTEESLWKGTASLVNMPYFDNGKLGTTDIYYAVMPKIIMFDKTPEFLSDYRFYDFVFEITKMLARQYVLREQKFGYPFYLRENFKYLNSKLDNTKIKKHRRTIEKIILASYRAAKYFKGIDLHSGNIGYLPQKPQTLLFFDM